jgi:hypothetical protein
LIPRAVRDGTVIGIIAGAALWLTRFWLEFLARRILRLSILLFGVALVAFALAELVGQPNSYSLTREAAFEIPYRDRVLPYWNKPLEAGKGVDSLACARWVF